MPDLLKKCFDPEFVRTLASEAKKLYPKMETELFEQRVFDDEWGERQLKQRMRHITVTLHDFLPFSFAQQVALLTEIAASFKGLPAMVFPDFVEYYGLQHSAISIPALEYLTQFSSAEFAVRPFFEQDFEKMIKCHTRWAQHDNYHVRRLASEGCRPRLPWAMSVKRLKVEPKAILPILELLVSDESEYVRRSVANNLNDISKDHPEQVLAFARKWEGKDTKINRLIQHGLRTLLKKGDKEALKICGVDHEAKADLSAFQLQSEELNLGDSLQFNFALENPSQKPVMYRLEYAVYYLKSNGSHSKKVFQLSKTELKGGDRKEFKKSQSLKDFTTRKHYPGMHYLSLIINGKEQEKKSFILFA